MMSKEPRALTSYNQNKRAPPAPRSATSSTKSGTIHRPAPSTMKAAFLFSFFLPYLSFSLFLATPLPLILPSPFLYLLGREI